MHAFTFYNDFHSLKKTLEEADFTQLLKRKKDRVSSLILNTTSIFNFIIYNEK